MIRSFPVALSHKYHQQITHFMEKEVCSQGILISINASGYYDRTFYPTDRIKKEARNKLYVGRVVIIVPPQHYSAEKD